MCWETIIIIIIIIAPRMQVDTSSYLSSFYSAPYHKFKVLGLVEMHACNNHKAYDYC